MKRILAALVLMSLPMQATGTDWGCLSVTVTEDENLLIRNCLNNAGDVGTKKIVKGVEVGVMIDQRLGDQTDFVHIYAPDGYTAHPRFTPLEEDEWVIIEILPNVGM